MDRLPRLTADHSTGCPISRDDLWWLLAQVYQLRAQLASAQETVVDPLADVAPQCNLSIELDEGPSRCQYSIGHPGPHSYEEAARCTSFLDDPWFTRCVFNAGHTGTHSYERHVQCIPAGAEGLRECTYEPGHRSPHSFEVGAMDIRPATSGPRKCGQREDDRRCSREWGHSGPCMLQTDLRPDLTRRQDSEDQRPAGHGTADPRADPRRIHQGPTPPGVAGSGDPQLHGGVPVRARVDP